MRSALIQELLAYTAEDSDEASMVRTTVTFLNANSRCFERTLATGHVTGSAWIVNRDRTHALMTHHAKLGKWLQLGGHCDGDSDVPRVALREATEESGLGSLVLVSPSVFDVDVHLIPRRGAEPEHPHYDIRYLFEADMGEDLTVSAESRSLAWMPFHEIEALLNPSLTRMVRKTAKAQLFPR